MTDNVKASQYLLGAASALALGLLVVLLAGPLEDPPVGAAQTLLASVCAFTIAWSGRSCIRAARGRGRWTHLGSLILGIGSVLAFLLPGVQLLQGDREFRLAQQGLAFAQIPEAVAAAHLVMALALIAFLLGEVVGARGAEPRRLRTRIARFDLGGKGTWLVLVVLTAVSTLISLQDSLPLQAEFASRGTVEGEGLLAVLGWAPALAAAIAILGRHYRSKGAVAITLAFVALLTVSGNRSPLLLIFLALALRYLGRLDTPGRTARSMIAIAVAAYLGATMLVAISTWRGEVIRGQESSLTRTAGEAIANPYVKLSGAGLDSLDGLILAMRIDGRTVGAKWTDPSKALTGFVPHQIWPAKPPWLSNTVARVHLRFGASGMFLSGAGYAWLIWGGAIGAIATFLLLGLGSSYVLAASRGAFGLGSLLAVYFLVRFAFGGDAFDAFHVLGLAALTAAAATTAHVLRSLRP